MSLLGSAWAAGGPQTRTAARIRARRIAGRARVLIRVGGHGGAGRVENGGGGCTWRRGGRISRRSRAAGGTPATGPPAPAAASQRHPEPLGASSRGASAPRGTCLHHKGLLLLRVLLRPCSPSAPRTIRNALSAISPSLLASLFSNPSLLPCKRGPSPASAAASNHHPTPFTTATPHNTFTVTTLERLSRPISAPAPPGPLHHSQALDPSATPIIHLPVRAGRRPHLILPRLLLLSQQSHQHLRQPHPAARPRPRPRLGLPGRGPKSRKAGFEYNACSDAGAAFGYQAASSRRFGRAGRGSTCPCRSCSRRATAPRVGLAIQMLAAATASRAREAGAGSAHARRGAMRDAP